MQFTIFFLDFYFSGQIIIKYLLNSTTFSFIRYVLGTYLLQSTILVYDHTSKMSQAEIAFKLPGVMRNIQINTKQGRRKKMSYKV